MSSDRHVVILGLMSAGKTSVGRRVAERLRRELIDGDVRLERASGGLTAADIADASGVEHLHALEAEIALEALREPVPAVIGPAASVIEVDAVRDALAEHVVVWLSAPAEHLAAKAGQKDHRPLLDDGDPLALFRHQIAVREPLIVPLADLVIEVTSMPKDAQADAIVALL